MGFLGRLLRFVPAAERRGIHIEEPERWLVSATADVSRFLRALPLLAPAGSLAYFEDTGERHVADYLSRTSVDPPVQVALGTIWPRPDVYHLPLTAASMEALASFIDEHPTGFFCAHCHVHNNGSVLLEWHDAFMDVPMGISKKIDADVVARFAAALGSTVTVGV